MLQREILEVGGSNRGIKRAVINGQACQATIAEDFDQFFFGCSRWHSHNIGLWDGHIFNAHPAQIKHTQHRSCRFDILSR